MPLVALQLEHVNKKTLWPCSLHVQKKEYWLMPAGRHSTTSSYHKYKHVYNSLYRHILVSYFPILHPDDTGNIQINVCNNKNCGLKI